MTPDDKASRETLALLAQLVASISDRLDGQAAALDRLAEAQEQARAHLAAVSPDRLSAATAKAVRDGLAPTLHGLVDAMEGLGGTKALLRQRLRAFEAEEAIWGRWRLYPLTLVAGIPLALVTVLVLTVPRAAAQTPLICRIAGGEWLVATDTLPAACIIQTGGGD